MTGPLPLRVERLLDTPIISPASHPSIGDNIQGPSLVRVPDWVPEPLGRYLLYFADHKGTFIRLAFAEALEGPWTVHAPGSLQLSDSLFPTTPPPAPPGAAERIRAWAKRKGVTLGDDWEAELNPCHIASPDVHVDEANRRFAMYFHGLESFGHQVTRVATSQDGLHFRARPEVLGPSYFRVFQHDGWHYALAMPGVLFRSRDGLSGFEKGPTLFEPDMRHSALWKRGQTLHVFWTRVGDAPERIWLSTLDLAGPWEGWRESPPVEVLRPERPWEGADAPVEPSVRGAVYGHVNQLRDPAIFEEDGRTWLLYAVAGESGIAIARLRWEGDAP
jgi:hypothetical protein